MKPIVLLFFVVSAFSVQACTVSREVSASKQALNSSARSVIGTSLVGAQGKTAADQDKIDETAARLCGASVWSQSECLRHEQGSAL
ncbi:hypothetical protein [Tianweitania sediminis]|uniref:Lipoprotein n=1 Tax=Tianweitania sediminis TaxID=1502156 RepID=A0A8J7RMD4_9HYPH|nr:hypothetical protein [Tianweitania sediminis]MBP0438399.1 hypothetical protein [Tianweitania sediminis]